MTDVTTEIYSAIRRHFFDDAGQAIPFRLRAKRNTQDDPFDEYLALHVLSSLSGIECIKASALVTPDLVLFRPARCEGATAPELAEDVNCIVGVEVKKLERTRQGKIARASGLDYNTTPPCGRIRVYDAEDKPIVIRGFYLFVCLEPDRSDSSSLKLTAAALVDGNLLNADFDLYLSIVGEREKRVGLGTYANGADRTRPMLIFANPLGVPELDRSVTLVHPWGTLATRIPDLRLVHQIERTSVEGETRLFSCYRIAADVPDGWQVSRLTDPFPTPVRETRTQPRGRLRLPFRTE